MVKTVHALPSVAPSDRFAAKLGEGLRRGIVAGPELTGLGWPELGVPLNFAGMMLRHANADETANESAHDCSAERAEGTIAKYLPIKIGPKARTTILLRPNALRWSPGCGSIRPQLFRLLEKINKT